MSSHTLLYNNKHGDTMNKEMIELADTDKLVSTLLKENLELVKTIKEDNKRMKALRGTVSFLQETIKGYKHMFDN